MPLRRRKAVGLLLALASVAVLHFSVGTSGAVAHVWHLFFAKLYFVPIVAGALWFGFRGAFAAAVAASGLQALHAWLDWGDPMMRMDQQGEIASFLLLGAVSGTLATLERRSRDRARRAEGRAQREKVGTAVAALTETLTARDPETGAHSHRVARLSEGFGRFLGLPRSEVRSLYLAGLLHDMGKVGVRDDILLKPGSLTHEEHLQIMEHPKIGQRILAPIGFEKVVSAIASHHEHLDGSGYPAGLAGEAIPLLGRVLAIVDTYDALAAPRPYKPALTADEVRTTMAAMAEIKLDPVLLARFWEFLGSASH